jgi:hypothetical protein
VVVSVARLSSILALFLVALSLLAFLVATLPSYPNTPVDSIYISVGPRLEQPEAIRVWQFIFTVFVATNTIDINGRLEFNSRSNAHYLDFYLPYIIYNYTSQMGGVDLNTRAYPDTVDGKCSLLHVDIKERSKGAHEFSFRIHTNQLATVSPLGEERIILTFGNAESSYRLWPLNKYRGEQPVDISSLTPLIVMAVTDEHHFFSSDCYPSPDVQFLKAQWRIATWQMNFSGALSNFYRSIDCTIVDPWSAPLQQVLIFVSGSVLSLGTTMLVNPYLARIETARGYLLYRRIRRRILQALGQWRKLGS